MASSKVYTTTASIKPETKAKLRLLKIHPRQPEDEVISRLVDQELAKRNLGKVLNTSAEQLGGDNPALLNGGGFGLSLLDFPEVQETICFLAD